MTAAAAAPPADRRVVAAFELEPAELACLRSLHKILTAAVRGRALAQWRAAIEGLPWFAQLALEAGERAALAEAAGRFLERLLGGEPVEDLYDEAAAAASAALRRGVGLADLLEAASQLEAILDSAIRQRLRGAGRQAAALAALGKFLKSLLCIALETHRREAAEELADRGRELAEALEQQAATAEVLRVINASPGDLAPVFDAMLDKALGLCGASYGVLRTYDGECIHAIAIRGADPSYAEFLRGQPSRPGPLTAHGRLVRGEDVVHIADVAADEAFRSGDPRRRGLVELGLARSYVVVALRKDDKLLGSIAAYRKEVRPFTDRQIALLQNFAAQAVIAMENARLITETREALEQQTATAEVLRVINSSPGNLAPVFDAMLEKARRLCEAAFGILLTYDGERFRHAALHSIPAAYAEYMRAHPPIYGPGTSPGRLAAGERLVHVLDMTDTDSYRSGDPNRRAIVDLAGARTLVAVPLRKDDILLGAIVVFRQIVQPFSDKQIALLQNFAAQAVIAMENARLITETREALEQQTATAEVLQVINSSPGDLAPVFDAMLDKAMRLCGAAFGGLTSYDGERFHTLALRGLTPDEAAAFRDPWIAGPGSTHENLVRGETLVHGDPAPSDPARRAHPQSRALDEHGARMRLVVALRKDDALLGSLWFYRKEARPFSEKEVALLQNFAAQAVVAMENARLLTETREALEQQTATAEVLQVINASPGDLAPVFDAIVERAMRLCEAAFGFLIIVDGEEMRSVALRNVPEQLAEYLREPMRFDQAPVVGGAIRRGQVVHVDDLSTTDAYRQRLPIPVAAVEAGGVRTVLYVPLTKDEQVLGVLIVFRQEIRPFSDKQIALLQNFAAQAVIAMENARLLNETRERTRELQESLEYQTATSDVLKVISRSDAELEPVLENLVETAARLCQADHGYVFRRREDGLHYLFASFGVDPGFRKFMIAHPFAPDRGTLSGRVALERRIVHIGDAATDPEYAWSEAQQRGNLRTGLGVPLLREDTLLGIIVLYRSRVEPFSDKQIDLVRTFADQAVIAIENARLLNELRDRTRDLQESLEYQTATSDVLKVISQSTFDLRPVLETVAETAARLCDTEIVTILRRQGEQYRVVAAQGWSPEYRAFLENHSFAGDDRGTLTGRVVLQSRAIHVADVTADPEYTLTESVTLGKARTQLGVPLLREGSPIGVIILSRQRVEPFTDKQIELVTTFADQAVIAIENTRLLTELREALEQQQAMAEILQVINSSPGDLQPVFDIVLDKAMQLCGAAFGTLHVDEGNIGRIVSILGIPSAYAEFRRRNPIRPGQPGIAARIRDGERFVHILDLKEEELYRTADAQRRAMVDLGGARTALAVGLWKEQVFLGAILIYRQEVRPFSEKQIALLESFAAQAVIAMDNARLLGEIRQRQAELRVTFDNMGDGVAMFDAEMRLAAWNLNFQQLLDLPEALLAKRPSFAEYLRYLAERGEYGHGDVEEELSRRLDRTDQELRFERTRPDGRVIEVRRNAVPGGGFVLIYGDVTERKRAEAEIRAARDAAEKALHDLRAAQTSLVHVQKMAALGQLTAGIAHEIKNPLNFVNNFAGLSVELLDELKQSAAPAIAALDDDTRAEIDETVRMLTSNLEKIAEHGQRADGIVRSMLQHSRGGSGDWQRTDVNALVEEALNLAYHGARAQDQSFNITMERELDRGLEPIELVPQDVMRVFLNLFGNGFYAAAKKSREAGDGFRPILKVTTRELGEGVEVRVRDNGTGIAPEHRDKLFQPFFTTKPTGEGTGLGLSISYDIVTQQHGGTITVASEPGAFTEFTIRLPRRGPAGPAAPERPRAPN